MSDPNQRALVEAQAKDEWRMMRGGPRTRSGQRELERDLTRRQRTIELMHDHPEMTFDEQEARHAGKPTGRERAAYPERFRGETRPPVKSLDRRGARTAEEAEDLRTTGMSPEHRQFLHDQADRASWPSYKNKYAVIDRTLASMTCCRGTAAKCPDRQPKSHGRQPTSHGHRKAGSPRKSWHWDSGKLSAPTRETGIGGPRQDPAGSRRPATADQRVDRCLEARQSHGRQARGQAEEAQNTTGNP